MVKEHNLPKGIIQVYPAYDHHSEVVIIGNKEALENLTQALKEAIENGKSQASVWASDGEGYDILIKQVDDGWDNKIWNKLPPHYTADWINKDCEINSTKFYLNEKK